MVKIIKVVFKKGDQKMQTAPIIIVILCCIYLAIRLHSYLYKPPQKCNEVEFLLFKLSRISGKSEHEIFHKAAEEWGRMVPERTVEQHFTTYLKDGDIPHYVTKFITENRARIYSYRIPPGAHESPPFV